MHLYILPQSFSCSLNLSKLANLSLQSMHLCPFCGIFDMFTFVIWSNSVPLTFFAQKQQNSLIVRRAGVWGLQEFLQFWKSTFINVVLVHFYRFAPLARQFTPFEVRLTSPRVKLFPAATSTMCPQHWERRIRPAYPRCQVHHCSSSQDHRLWCSAPTRQQTR